MATQAYRISSPKFPYVKVRLVGEDGNAFSILGRVTRSMREAGIEDEDIAEFVSEATAGDYNHLLQTTMRRVEVR